MRRSKPYFILSAILVAALIGFPFHLSRLPEGAPAVVLMAAADLAAVASVGVEGMLKVPVEVRLSGGLREALL